MKNKIFMMIVCLIIISNSANICSATVSSNEFSIYGIKLGMTYQEVIDKLGRAPMTGAEFEKAKSSKYDEPIMRNTNNVHRINNPNNPFKISIDSNIIYKNKNAFVKHIKHYISYYKTKWDVLFYKGLCILFDDNEKVFFIISNNLKEFHSPSNFDRDLKLTDAVKIYGKPDYTDEEYHDYFWLNENDNNQLMILEYNSSRTMIMNIVLCYRNF